MKKNRTCKIYKLTNKINGKFYVGQTWQSYKKRMNHGQGYKNNKHLYAAIILYKEENFEYETLFECTDQIEANNLEVFYIKQYDARNHDIAYNVERGGSPDIPFVRKSAKGIVRGAYKWKYSKEELEFATVNSFSVSGVMRELKMNTTSSSSMTRLSKKIKELNIDTSHFTGQLWSKGKSLGSIIKPDDVNHMCQTCLRTFTKKKLVISNVNGSIIIICRPCRKDRTKYSLELVQYLTAKCIDCNSEITCGAFRCSSCYENSKPKLRQKYKTKIVWKSTSELVQLAKELGFVALGKQLGVSDSAVRNRIRDYPNYVVSQS